MSSSAHPQNPNYTVDLLVEIGDDNEVIVGFTEDGGPVRLGAESGLSDLLVGRDGAGSITVEIRDFYQNHTVYSVYGFTLAGDGRRIAAYWEDNEDGTGKRHTMTIAGGRLPACVIGATPESLGGSEPIPFAPGARESGSFPISRGGRDGQTGG